LLVEGADRDAGVIELFQALYLTGAVRLASPTVLRVHVEDQVDGDVLLHDPAQQQTGQEGLAGPGLAEDPARALDEALEVDADARGHVEWLADVEVGLVLGAEDARDVGVVGL